MKRLLLLGGTAQARALAARLAGNPDLTVTLSLAGRTARPLDQGVPTRVGGFGGAAGLAEYLAATDTDILIDATHPYAQQMSRHADQAAHDTGAACLHLSRPPWGPAAGENWIEVPDIDTAVAALPPGARAFTATGRGSLAAFARRTDIYTCLRVIDPPAGPFPGHGEFIVGRPPFTVEAELQALRRTRATHLVIKNAGGDAGRTKLTAAAQLGLPIIIVARTPLPEGGEVVETVDAAFNWLAARL